MRDDDVSSNVVESLNVRNLEERFWPITAYIDKLQSKLIVQMPECDKSSSPWTLFICLDVKKLIKIVLMESESLPCTWSL